ncbi:hypothetical protein H6P81_011992 [Aristolochia fimbriata]|uniref:Uncharacterized protein n=1 Tax=Aristolochia fimbriata TaxID=158543 RepID=A0AAV7EAX7_ARIFI|nr:hypothetical protein H6P81_011992 [Aristolochia fimbriata]
MEQSPPHSTEDLTTPIKQTPNQPKNLLLVHDMIRLTSSLSSCHADNSIFPSVVVELLIWSLNYHGVLVLFLTPFSFSFTGHETTWTTDSNILRIDKSISGVKWQGLGREGKREGKGRSHDMKEPADQITQNLRSKLSTCTGALHLALLL